MRHRNIVSILLGSTVLASGAAMAADAFPLIDLPVAEEAPRFSLTLEGGVSAYNIPDTDTVGRTNQRVLFEGLDDTLYGGTLGARMVAPINETGGAIGAYGFISYATRSGSQHYTPRTDDYLVIHGPSLPAGTIVLDNDLSGQDGTGESDVSGGGLVTDILTDDIPDFDVTPGTNSFVLAGATGDYHTQSHGIIANSTGMIYVAVGEIEGHRITTNTTQNLWQAGGDVTFSQSSDANGGTQFTGYVGPSYRFLRTETFTDIKVEYPIMNEFPDDNDVMPTYTQNTDETIDTHYAGAVAGADVNIEMGPNSLRLGVGGGAYYASSGYDSRTEARLTGGDQDRADYAYSDLELDPVEGFAYTLKSQGTFTAAIADQMQVNFGLGAEYMSRVATSRFVGSDAVTGVNSLDANYDNEDGDATGRTVLEFGDAWSYNASVGLTGQF